MARVGRHLSDDKKMHWHIDHLIRFSSEREAIIFPSHLKEECRLNRSVEGIEGSRTVVRGFGSSDCHCSSHLHFLTKNAARSLDQMFCEEGRVR